MIVKIVRAGKVEVISDAKLVIVEDVNGNPVSIAAKHGPGDGFTVCCIDDEERLNRTLRNLGIDKVVVKVPLDPQLKSPERLPIINPYG
jgi:hypothetical protein